MIGLLDKLRGRKTPRIPDDLWAAIVTSIPFLDALDHEEQQRLRDLAETFLGSKEFTTGGGLQLTDEICVSIAAQGCLPILNLGLGAYRDWVGIIVYPDEFVVPRNQEDENGVVHEYDDVLAGEAWEGGPLIVSWHDVKMAGDGYNVVIHEFAHKLDMLNGDTDGVPKLHSGIAESEWQMVFLAAYDDFCRRADSGEETIIDPYASESPGEFFAVLSESFFELPDVVADEYPDLYALFKRYYRQDPLARLRRPNT
ncbi:zinc-dependent peptidase [Dechloromonas sp. XY25]|uniref:Zinc-dependent peptidase n=1 Tax=Dechloromonas hankyongensis TaxID=2908002 RepID=A0ABS9K4G7_9RHOO|nr:M90 family metallopeptidase [Dechloromonas hankyongensis]MCG2578040.1 zinc-dependent peptidase [Dechloromonas hankyongensis]